MSIMSLFSFFLIIYISGCYLRYYIPLKMAYGSGYLESMISIFLASIDFYILTRLIFIEDPGYVSAEMVKDILQEYQVDESEYIEQEVPQVITEKYFKRQGLIPIEFDPFELESSREPLTTAEKE